MTPEVAGVVTIAAARAGGPILVAEDDPISRQMLARTLREHGHAVIEVADGDAAWTCCCGPEPPRIVILDWMMPGLSGLEVCQRLRATARRPYTFVILVTSKNRHEDVLGGFAAGVDELMTKPYMADELIARVHAAERLLGLAGGAPGVSAALREAGESAGGDVIVRDGATVGRILFHHGRVAWVHLSSEPGSLVEVLVGAVAPGDVRAVMAEAAASGCNFAEILVQWRLIAADALRTRVRDWLRARLRAVLALDPWNVMFVPQRRTYGGDLTFTLAELLPDDAPSAQAAVASSAPRRSSPLPALPASPALLPAPFEMWPSPRVASVLCRAKVGAGVRVVAVFDAPRGRCVGIRGKPLDVSLMLALTRLPHDGPAGTSVDELVVIRERRYHLLRRAATPGYFIYLELERGAANLEQAREVLRTLADRMEFDAA